MTEFRKVSTSIHNLRQLASRARVMPFLAGAFLVAGGAQPLSAQVPRVVELTLESAAEMAMNDSYSVRRVRLEIDRTRLLLEAERAALKSKVSLNFSLPQFQQISEQRWNSVLQRNETVGENSRRWQMDFSIEQPVVVGGYTTNGYLSLNNRVYRYTQIEDEDRDLTYYNRYFVCYRQPLFQPNALKNNLEGARLNLESAELDFQGDAIQIITSVAQDYYELLEQAYQEVIQGEQVTNLEQALAAANERAAADPARGIDVSQVQVALSNARSELQQARSDFRIQVSSIKPSLGLDPQDSVVIRPATQLAPVEVDLARAIELGLTLRPQLRSLQIQRRESEISLANSRGRNGFRMDVELMYGREMQDPEFQQLLDQPKNSYTLAVTGTLPIWDWGERRARVEAQRLVLDRTDLSIEQTREQIEVGITNTVRNLTEYQERAQSMQENQLLATQVSAQTLQQYRNGEVTIQDLIQSFNRQQDTAENFIQAYLGYREAILDLQRMTYYDFETQSPMLQRYGLR